MTKIQYIVMFLRKSDKGYIVVNQLKLKQIEEKVYLKNREYIVKIDTPNFYVGLNCYYLLDYDNGQQLHFEEEKKNQLTPDEIDMLLRKHLVRDLAIGIKSDKNHFTLFHLIALALLGFLVASLIFTSYYNNKMQKLIEQYQNSTLPPITTIFSLLKIYWRSKLW